MTSYDLVTAVTEADTMELWPVYDGVFADVPDLAAWRSRTWDRHVARSGFRLARVYAPVEGDVRRLAGFAYGYTGERGQWWSDQLARVLPPDVAGEWLGGHFELVSIGVLEAWRGRGFGRGLLREVTRDLPHERWLLATTGDPDDPARRLYASQGWRVVGPGLGDGEVVMGRRRP